MQVTKHYVDLPQCLVLKCFSFVAFVTMWFRPSHIGGLTHLDRGYISREKSFHFSGYENGLNIGLCLSRLNRRRSLEKHPV